MSIFYISTGYWTKCPVSPTGQITLSTAICLDSQQADLAFRPKFCLDWQLGSIGIISCHQMWSGVPAGNCTATALLQPHVFAQCILPWCLRVQLRAVFWAPQNGSGSHVKWIARNRVMVFLPSPVHITKTFHSSVGSPTECKPKVLCRSKENNNALKHFPVSQSRVLYELR